MIVGFFATVDASLEQLTNDDFSSAQQFPANQSSSQQQQQFASHCDVQQRLSQSAQQFYCQEDDEQYCTTRSAQQFSRYSSAQQVSDTEGASPTHSLEPLTNANSCYLPSPPEQQQSMASGGALQKLTNSNSLPELTNAGLQQACDVSSAQQQLTNSQSLDGIVGCLGRLNAVGNFRKILLLKTCLFAAFLTKTKLET
jgi:hypothetical protein